MLRRHKVARPTTVALITGYGYPPDYVSNPWHGCTPQGLRARLSRPLADLASRTDTHAGPGPQRLAGRI